MTKARKKSRKSRPAHRPVPGHLRIASNVMFALRPDQKELLQREPYRCLSYLCEQGLSYSMLKTVLIRIHYLRGLADQLEEEEEVIELMEHALERAQCFLNDPYPNESELLTIRYVIERALRYADAMDDTTTRPEQYRTYKTIVAEIERNPLFRNTHT